MKIPFKIPTCLESKTGKEYTWLFFCSSGLFLFHGLRDLFIVPAVYLSLPTSNDLNSTWHPSIAGLSVASCHTGIMIGHLIIPSVIGKYSLNMQMRGSLFFTGLFAMFILKAAAYAWSLIIVRALQGIAQAWIYVITYAVLQEYKLEKFATGYTLIFCMPWIGSAVGIAIGCTFQHEVFSFVFGSLCIILSMSAILLSSGDKFEMGTKEAWKETLKSKGALSTAGFHAGNTLALHTFLMGLPCTLLLIENNINVINWSYFGVFIALATGIFTLLFGLLRVWFINSSLLSVLKRRKLLTLGGIIIIVVCLSLAGTIGRHCLPCLIIPCVIGTAIGGSISISAARMCFHDLAPCFPIPIMHIGNIAASFGAVVASFMFLAISGGPIDDTNELYNTAAWIIPACIEILLIVQFVIFLSVDTLPHQFSNTTEEKFEIPTISFMVDPSFIAAQARKSVDGSKSFKSVKSHLTYKSAASCGRNPSGSFVSMPDGEMMSVCESGICRSIDTERDPEMLSVKSDLSYKSVIGDMNNVVLKTDGKSSADLYRTYEWLTAYHIDGQSQSSNHDERENAQRNMLLALQW